MASRTRVGLSKAANSVLETDIEIVSSTFPPVTVSMMETMKPVLGTPLYGFWKLFTVKDIGVPAGMSTLVGLVKLKIPVVVSKEHVKGPAVMPVTAVQVGALDYIIQSLFADDGFHLGVTICIVEVVLKIFTVVNDTVIVCPESPTLGELDVTEATIIYAGMKSVIIPSRVIALANPFDPIKNA